jgi:hypothetical protein
MLPSCVNVNLATQLVGRLSPASLAAGDLPRNIRIGAANIQTISPNKMTGSLSFENTVSSANFDDASISLDRILYVAATCWA